MVEVCTAFDTAGTCTASAWMPYTGNAWPTLSIADAQTLGLAIAGLWAVAFGIRMMKKVLQEA